MRTVLWMLVGVNVLAAAVAFYASLGKPPYGPALLDVLHVLSGTSLLTAAGLTYLLVRKTSNHDETFAPPAPRPPR